MLIVCKKRQVRQKRLYRLYSLILIFGFRVPLVGFLLRHFIQLLSHLWILFFPKRLATILRVAMDVLHAHVARANRTSWFTGNYTSGEQREAKNK